MACGRMVSTISGVLPVGMCAVGMGDADGVGRSSADEDGVGRASEAVLDPPGPDTMTAREMAEGNAGRGGV